MAISFDVPPDVENLLAARFPDPGQAAKEALTIEGYRNGKFGVSTVRRLLGLGTRAEAERWLFERRVPINYSPDDLEADRRTLDRLFGEDV
jgi:hypothetical protein